MNSENNIMENNSNSVSKSSKRNEKLCFFGLLTFRSGILITCSASFMLSLYVGLQDKEVYRETMEISRETVNVSRITAKVVHKSLSVFHTFCVLPAGLYGAYSQSFRVIKYYKKLLWTDIVITHSLWYINIGRWAYKFCKGAYTSTMKEVEDQSAFYMVVLYHGVSFTLISLLVLFLGIKIDKYRLYLANEYERSLLLNEEE